MKVVSCNLESTLLSPPNPSKHMDCIDATKSLDRTQNMYMYGIKILLENNQECSNFPFKCTDTNFPIKLFHMVEIRETVKHRQNGKKYKIKTEEKTQMQNLNDLKNS